MRAFRCTALIPIAIVAAAAVVAAQAPPPEVIAMQAGAAGGLPGKGPMLAMHLSDTMDVSPVKGVPFCANVVTEHTQSFADGNRIHTTENSSLCRDSEGRTRRDASLNLLGASPQGSAPKLVTIVDPVAGVRYMLDSEHKFAHKMPFPPGPPGAGQPVKGEQIFMLRAAPPDGPAVTTNMFYKKVGADANEPPPASEDLGDQTINGIHATGTRVTTTIPSGKMGNDKPIVVTSERWYSADLKATVMTKHDDPWAGNLKTEFTNVNMSEPDASLFLIPSDYTIVEDKDGPVTIRMQAPVP